MRFVNSVIPLHSQQLP